MINKKKKINKIKTETFLKEFPIVFLLQHNNFTVNEWFEFKQKINQLKNNSIKRPENSSNLEILNIKNSLLKKILQSSDNTEKKRIEIQKSLCQGPNFMIGCKNDDQLNSLWNCINSNSKLLFISCFYKNQLLNHLDFEILLKTNSSIYQTLVFNLNKKTEFVNVLQNSLILYPLFVDQLNLLRILELLKQIKKK